MTPTAATTTGSTNTSDSTNSTSSNNTGASESPSPRRVGLPTVPEILDKVSDLADEITARLPELKMPALAIPQVKIPEIKVPRPDLDRVPGVAAVKRIPSMFSIDLTDLDVRRLAESEVVGAAKRVAGEVKEAAFTAVGFGVLAVQKAQVRRREFFDARRGDGPAVVTPAPSTVATPASVATPSQQAGDADTGNTGPTPA